MGVPWTMVRSCVAGAPESADENSALAPLLWAPWAARMLNRVHGGSRREPSTASALVLNSILFGAEVRVAHRFGFELRRNFCCKGTILSKTIGVAYTLDLNNNVD